MNKWFKMFISLLLCISITVPIFTIANAKETEIAEIKEEKRQIFQSTDYLFEVIGQKEVTILFYIGTATRVTTPSRLGGYPVTRIDNWAFYNTNVEKVTVGEGVTHIGNEVFSNCKKLTAVTLPSTLTQAGDAVFKNSTKLRTVSFKYSEHPVILGESFLFNCTSLISVTLPNGVTTISDSMLTYCGNLKTITLPENIKSIEDYAFYDSGLSYIEFPEKLEYIGNYAFANTNALYEITAKGEDCEVRENAFYGCPVGNPFEPEPTTTTNSEPVISPTTEPEILTTPGYDDPPPIFTTSPEITPPSDEFITIYFTNSKGWENVYIYGFYGETGSEITDKPLGEYPGTEMTFVEENDYGQAVYKASIPADIDYIKFSDGSEENHRTNNIGNSELGHNIGFYLEDKDGKYWLYSTYTYSPSSPVKPTTSIITEVETATTIAEIPPSPTNGEFDDPEFVTVYFTNNMSLLNPSFFYWGVNYFVEWPGTPMTYIGTNYEEEEVYRAEVPSDAFGIIFNGMNPEEPYEILQTEDITDFHNQQGFYCEDIVDGKITVSTYEFSGDITPPEKKKFLGDANSDDHINIIDVLEIKKHIIGLITDSFYKKAADIDSSGQVNVRDATALHKYLAGFPTSYPIGKPLNSGGNSSPATKPENTTPPSDKQGEGVNVGGSMYYPMVGDVITYSVALSSTELIGAIQATVRYDSDKLELIRHLSNDPDTENWEVEGPEFCPNLDGVILNADLENEIRFNASKVNGYNFKERKVLITLQFTVLDTSYNEINLDMEHIVNKNGEDINEDLFCGLGIPSHIVPSTGTTTEGVPHPTNPNPGDDIDTIVVNLRNFYSAMAAPDNPGDADGNGTINIRDADYIQKYIAGLEPMTDDQIKNSDVNTDGSVNIKDSTIIQKFIAGLKTGSILDNLLNF